MTSLTDEQINQMFPVTKAEINDYIKRRRLRLPQDRRAIDAFRQRIRRRLVETKIRNAPGTEVSFTYSAEPWQIVYGKMRVGAVITFINTLSNNQFLDMVYTIAGHKISSIDKVWIDNEQVIYGASPDTRWSTQLYNPDTNTYRVADHKVFTALNDGDPSNPAQPDLMARTPLWTANHKQSNRAHAFVILVSDAVLFPDGLPDVQFEISGKPCYDPRTASTAFTQNAALIIADFLMDPNYGLGQDISNLEMTPGAFGSFYDAADICDEDVTLEGGTTEKRYTINSTFSSQESPQNILEKMVTAIGGTITYVNGKWKCFPGSWRGATIALDEDDILEDLEVQTKVSRRDTFNAVRGTFNSAQKDFQEDDFPPYKNDYYMLLDNNQRVWEDIQFPCTTSAKTCQRLAKILVEQAHQQIYVRGTFKIAAYRVEVGTNVLLTYARLGWYNKPFEVQECELIVDVETDTASRFACRLALKETAEGIWAWNNGEETQYDLSGNTDLPDPFSVPTLAGLTLASGTAHLYITQDGTVVSRIFASWTQASDGFVANGGAIELQFKKSALSDWSAAITLPPSTSNYYILDVQDGVAYDVRIRAKNGLGIYGEYSSVTNYVVIGKTEKPSAVTGLGVNVLSYGIALGWAAVSDLDIDYYLLRVGAPGDSWAAMNPLAQESGTYFLDDLRPAGTYKYSIKSVDTSGNESVNEASATVALTGPSQPVVVGEVVGSSLQLTWAAVTGQFQILDYIIKYGDDYNTAIVLDSVLSNLYVEEIKWSGNRSYWVTARDVAGNLSLPGQKTITIVSPGVVQNLTADVIDNNVLLKWDPPLAGSLPVAFYKILKGGVYSSAVEVGQITGTFQSLFETVGGSYTYWVVPYDTADNEGAPSSLTANVLQPPDYVLLDDQNINEGDWDSLSNNYTENNKLIGVIDPAATWADRFAGHPTIQDLIDDGYIYWAEPMSFNTFEAIATKVIDYGTVLPSTIVTFSGLVEQVHSVAQQRVRISHSLDNMSYAQLPLGVLATSGSTSLQFLAQNFRYLRVQLYQYSNTETEIAVISNLNIKLDLKQKDDAGGPETALATDDSFTATITIASPAVVTATSHGWIEGTQVQFSTTGSLPTGIVAGTTYIVRNPTTNTFNLSTEAEGDLLNTSGSQSGVHTVKCLGTPVFFNIDYIDVSACNVTLCPTSAQLVGVTLPLAAPIVNLLDAPNPKSFNVLIYDSAGVRIDCDFRWSARGV